MIRLGLSYCCCISKLPNSKPMTRVPRTLSYHPRFIYFLSKEDSQKPETGHVLSSIFLKGGCLSTMELEDLQKWSRARSTSGILTVSWISLFNKSVKKKKKACSLRCFTLIPSVDLMFSFLQFWYRLLDNDHQHQGQILRSQRFSPLDLLRLSQWGMTLKDVLSLVL